MGISSPIVEEWYLPNLKGGLCHCGCGEKTKIAETNVARCGWLKDQPLRFIRGHATRGKKLPDTNGRRSRASQGRIMPEEAKEKLSVANIGERNPMFGKTHSSSTRSEMSRRWAGANNPRWNYGASTARQAWQSSSEAKAWRSAVFERDNYTCQTCGVRGGSLNAHHIEAWATYPRQRCNVSNGQTLCVPCHRLTDTYGCPAKVAA